jgi:DNA-binding SARP family transcriptional activator/tetratricopeptide (TPR) repeat protein
MPVMSGDRADAGLAVALLGPVEIGPAGGTMMPVAQPKLRVLLGLLGVAAGRVVTTEALVDGVWGEEYSPGREKNLHALVYQLRRRLSALEPEMGPEMGRARLARAGTGYRLALAPAELDVAVFRALAERGREARIRDAAGARVLFGQALGLWRGAALADAAPLCPRLAGEAARLEELRLAVTEERIECDLALGRPGEVAGELAGLVAEFPLRERLAGLVAEFPLRERLAALLMTALYRGGRRAEALAVYEAARRMLATQLGLDPGPELAGLQAKVLADDPALAAPDPVAVSARLAAPQVVPRQMPAGTGFFAGREAELKELDALLDQAGGEAEADGASGGAVVISAVAGMAGVGKTALAVHWARKMAHRFPDGQLYVNLRGYDGEDAAVTPEEAIGWFLVALGVPAGQIPADAQARGGLYRSVLAGRRVLIVLDNARDPVQVRPLLPGGPGCLVVVTSRSTLAGLAAAEGARPLRLGPLGEQEGVRLLAARLGPERVAAEPEAVTKLVARCGHLPLALAVMAARAAADPGLPLQALARQLARAEETETEETEETAAGAGAGRLEVLETGDPATSLRQLLSWSHRQLSSSAAAMFGLLGVHCGPDITAPAAASLAGVSRAEAGRALAELAGASLAAEHRPGRYVLHDLVRGYAAGLAWQAMEETGIRAAIERSVDHYLHTAVVSYLPRPFAVASPASGVIPERLVDEAEMLAWAQAEHEVLLRIIIQATTAGFITQAWQIFDRQAWFLAGQGYWADLRAADHALLAAAEAAGDQAALGWIHLIIGRYATTAGSSDQGLAHQARALDHFRRAGDLRGQAWAHFLVGFACTWKGDWAQAAPHGEQALALFRQTGDQTGHGWALAGVAGCHAHLGNYDLARRYAQQALEVAPEAGDPSALAFAYEAMGLARSRTGEHSQAISCYRRSLAFLHERQDPMTRGLLARVLAEYGDACRAADELPAAVEAWQQALQILHELGLPEHPGIRAKLEQAESLS